MANPADQAIYYYMEGMLAPMGSFNNYRREPKAVLIVDRSLRERAGRVFDAGEITQKWEIRRGLFVGFAAGHPLFQRRSEVKSELD